MKIYSVSTKHYYAFGCLVSEELSYKIKRMSAPSSLCLVFFSYDFIVEVLILNCKMQLYQKLGGFYLILTWMSRTKTMEVRTSFILVGCLFLPMLLVPVASVLFCTFALVYIDPYVEFFPMRAFMFIVQALSVNLKYGICEAFRDLILFFVL